ncbi:hypothetical protein CSUB01_05967 [Colletotrichum sublineola]|uniref:Uncharacterized protein n=1 Tax=Colletotrichum sublineola TaxID=1173701 RepID=A0A066X442_COLSU|nr:hypothetical protein CSUB01_05967 [Colletotrichum sublineola]
MSTRRNECTNAWCMQQIAALQSQVRELKSLFEGSKKHRPCDCKATGRFVRPKATRPLSPASTPSRCPDPEPRSSNVARPSVISFRVNPTPKKRDAGIELVDRFIERIPRRVQDWQNRSQCGGLTNTAGILKAFSINAPSICGVTPSGSLREKFPNHIVKRAKDISVALRQSDATDVLLNWGPVLFSAECRVALQLGVEPKVVNDAMNQVLALEFERRLNEIVKIIASDPAAEPEQTSFLLYLPFVVWAIIRRELGGDCFDEVCQALQSRNFLQSDFEEWYALLSVQSTPQTPADTQSEATTGLAQHKRSPVDVHMPNAKRQRSSGRPEQATSLPSSSDLALSDSGDGISTWDGDLGLTVSPQDSLVGNAATSVDTTHANLSQHVHRESYGTDSLRIDRGATSEAVHLANSGVSVPQCSFAQSPPQTGLTMMPLAEGPKFDDDFGVRSPLGDSESFQMAGTATSPDPGNHWSIPEAPEVVMPRTYEVDHQIRLPTLLDPTVHPCYLSPSEVLVTTQDSSQSNPATVQNMYGYSHDECDPCLWPTPTRPTGSSLAGQILGVVQPVTF